MDDDYDIKVILIMLLIFFLIMVGFSIGVSWEAELSQETLNDICINLAQNETAVGEVESEGTLTCTIPSFDSTHNIVIKHPLTFSPLIFQNILNTFLLYYYIYHKHLHKHPLNCPFHNEVLLCI